MPTTTKYRSDRVASYGRNTYQTNTTYGRYYSNTSTAYDIPTEYPQRRQQSPKPAPSRTKMPARAKATKAERVAMVRACSVAAAFLIVCCLVIYRYSVILESNQKIDELKSQIETIAASNQAMQAKIDNYIELGGIEKVAREELGMMKPESNQIFYIDMKLGDGGSAGSLSSVSGSAISGTPGALLNAFRSIR